MLRGSSGVEGEEDEVSGSLERAFWLRVWLWLMSARALVTLPTMACDLAMERHLREGIG